ncbi:hypothetical protein RJT34_24148 [Clitoria ternatea]|uniref:Uncharacterized protein n=1 Tax=Clitoria ternatea TaxID=43366 RepID=A0AAN9FMI8_CLITE
MNVDNAGAGGGRGQVPPKPPDIRVSFKEKVLGRATGDPQPVENLIKRGVMTLDNDNRLLPRFTMEEDDYQLGTRYKCPDVRQENHAPAKSPDVAQPENAEAIPELTNNLVPESTHGEWIVVKRNNKKPNTIALSKENESWKPGTTSMSGAFQHFSNGPSRDHMKTTIPSTRYKRPRRPTPSRESRERSHGSSPHAGDLDLHQDNLNSQPTFPLSTRINMQGTTMDDLDQHQGEFNIYPPTNSPIMHMKPRGPATATRAHTSSCPGVHARDYGMEQHGLRKMEDNSSTSLHHNEETMFSFGANHPQCPSNSDQGISPADKE